MVGAPKCGTTSMVEYLRAHPQVFVSRKKDLYYFGRDLGLQRRRLTEADYLAHFAEATDQVWVGECSVQYIRSERAPREILEWCSDPRILIMLRNPVDFLVSYHGQLAYHLEEDILDLEAAIRAQDDRRAGRRLARDCFAPGKLQYLEVAAFDEQVKRWFDALGRSRVHVIILDDMQADMAGAYRRTLEWLGVDATFQPSFARHNEKRWLTAPQAMRVMRKLPLMRKAMMKFVPQSMRRKGGAALSKALGTPERTSITPTFRAELQEHFRPSIDRLSEMLARDLSHWYRDQP